MLRIAPIVQRDRQLENVLVKIAWVVLAAGLQGPYQLGEDVAVKNRGQVLSFGDPRNNGPIQLVVDNRGGVTYSCRSEIHAALAVHNTMCGSRELLTQLTPVIELLKKGKTIA